MEADLKPTTAKIAEESSLDWRGRPSNPLKHGGMRAAAFVLGLQGFEIMAIAAVGNNLITYVINEMHFSLSKSANTVTNFIGTIFLLSLLGGYLSDSFLGCFWTILIFAFLELSGLILLSVQAHLPQLKPPQCDMLNESTQCEEAKGFQALIFFVALYLVALGSGCLKPNMITHGADQFNQRDEKQSKKLSSYFNAAYFAFSVGELIALTLLVYVQTHSGMDVGFGVSAAVMAMGIITMISGTFFYRNKPPQGSVFTPIVQVIVAATLKRKQVCQSDQGSHSMEPSTDKPISDSVPNSQLSQRFRFLNKACIKNEEESGWRVCRWEKVEQVKILISITPIFLCTIMFNTILAQLQTFSVQQASSMNTRLIQSLDFHIPPASLQSIPYLLLLLLVPLYDSLSLSSPLPRIAAGLLLSTFSMISAALVEHKRRNTTSLLSVWWLAPQFVIFGVSEMLTAVGLLEFFYKQPLPAGGMRASLTAITYCSYSFGFFLSSVLVSLVDRVTASASAVGVGWLTDNNLDNDRLDLFYWLLALLSFLNFLNYLFWSNWYSVGFKRGGSGDINVV
ncbi:protein NRT1/ PTR FAMILY 4.3-like [Salvia hispanica]|uniref:protein NRT1/ PTR FAMILY 4.3-like n=1 Tax=Salvia hispanica TaxID=49212 RepID=UPI002008F668|nr:protein NRT1/ PTR FAMILY 4.3-like [Salvia hispanica]